MGVGRSGEVCLKANSRMFSRVSGLYPPDAVVTPPSCDNQKCLLTVQISLWGVRRDCTQLRITALNLGKISDC